MKRLFNIQGLFGRKTRRIKELELEKEELLKSCNDKCWQLLCDLSDANTEKLKALKEVDDLNKKIEQLKEKSKTEKKELKVSLIETKEANRQLSVEIEKLQQEKEELKDKIKELEKKLEESMSDKYIVRKVRATKSKSQTMNMRSSVKQSNAIKLVKER